MQKIGWEGARGVFQERMRSGAWWILAGMGTAGLPFMRDLLPKLSEDDWTSMVLAPPQWNGHALVIFFVRKTAVSARDLSRLCDQHGMPREAEVVLAGDRDVFALAKGESDGEPMLALLSWMGSE